MTAMFEMTHLKRVGPMGQLAPDAMVGSRLWTKRR